MYKRLKELVSTAHGFPCVSIIVPTKRSMPDKAYVQAHVLKQVKMMTEKLSHISHPQASLVQKKLQEVVQNYDFTKIQDVLVFLAHANDAQGFASFGSCDEREVLGSVFALNEIYALLQEQVSYWVLILGKEDARLCRATNNVWDEIITPERDAQGNPVQGFPLQFLRPDDKTVESVGRGYLDAAYRDHHEVVFFELVDRELHKLIEKDPLPVVLCASAKTGDLMKRAANHRTHFVQHVVYDGISQRVSEIVPLVWPKIEQHYRKERDQLMKELDDARNTNRCAAGLQRVWEVMLDGRVKRLFVERGACVIGRVDLTNERHLQPFGKEEEGVTDNLIDILIAAAIRHNGEIVVMPQGTLKAFDGVAALLRY